jgi:hypothetical protein
MSRAKGVVKPTPVVARNRVIELRYARASEVQTHPLNWRVHGKHQRKVMRGLFKELGNVKPVDVYIPREGDRLVTEGRLKADVPCLMDGHLRKEELPSDFMLALNVTDLTEAEALKYLATCDPTSALAEQDDAKFAEVLSQIDSEDGAVMKMLGDLYDVPEGGDDTSGDDVPENYQILIECESEEQQRELLERFAEEGVKCRSMIS